VGYQVKKARRATLLIRNAGQLLTLRDGRQIGPRTGENLSNLGIIENGAVASLGAKILAAGSLEEVQRDAVIDKTTNIIDAQGKVVTPGFVDPHTHPVFAATREEEFELRVKGASYQEIADSGGGIRNSVRRFRATSNDQLTKNAQRVLDRMLSYGTTTIEAKSGYGLSLEDEVRSLQIIKDLNENHPIDLVPTFLGAHEVPDEYRDNREEYIRILTEEMIPRVAEGNLAEFCDVFCEEGVFDIEESRRILSTAKAYGLRLKLHADELSPFGGAELAAELGATSADHLVAISQVGIDRMKEAGVVAVLLPGTTFSLGYDKYAPARRMIEAGLPIALATDCNPGSSMTENMQMILSLASTQMRMTAAEGFCAATINSAYAIGRGEEVGSLEPNKLADLVIWDTENYKEIPYHYGVNLVKTVIKRGRVVYG